MKQKTINIEKEYFTMQIVRKDPYTISRGDTFNLSWRTTTNLVEMRKAQKELNEIMKHYNTRLI